MTFDSMDALKNYILSCSEIAIERATTKVNYIINHFLTQFYNEFTPDVYVRTEQLLRSLVKTHAVKTANGWAAEVYFDLSALDYSTRIVPSGKSWSKDNTFHKNPWTDENTEWVFETAMTGSKPHGGYASGTAIWTESIKELNAEKRNILRQALIDAGIPVK